MSLCLREAISFSELFLFKGVLTHRTFQTNQAMQFEKKKIWMLGFHQTKGRLLFFPSSTKYICFSSTRLYSSIHASLSEPQERFCGRFRIKRSGSHQVTHRSAGSPHWHWHWLDQDFKTFLKSQNNFVVTVFLALPEMLGRGNILPGYCSLKQIVWKFMKEEAKVFVGMTDSSRFSETSLNPEMTEEKIGFHFSFLYPGSRPLTICVIPLFHCKAFKFSHYTRYYSGASKTSQHPLPSLKPFLCQLSLSPSFYLQPNSSRTVTSVHFVTALLPPNWFLRPALEVTENFYGLQIQWRVLGSIQQYNLKALAISHISDYPKPNSYSSP